jgi:hypothetical protein
VADWKRRVATEELSATVTMMLLRIGIYYPSASSPHTSFALDMIDDNNILRMRLFAAV